MRARVHQAGHIGIIHDEKHFVSTIFSCLVLILVLVNILLAIGNQSIQSEVGERQQMISQAIQLEAVHRQVVGALTEMALKTNDAQLKDLLAASGFSLSPSPAPGKVGK